MVEMMNAKEIESRNNDVAIAIFKEVLGNILGYSRVLSDYVILESSKMSRILKESINTMLRKMKRTKIKIQKTTNIEMNKFKVV